MLQSHRDILVYMTLDNARFVLVWISFPLLDKEIGHGSWSLELLPSSTISLMLKVQVGKCFPGSAQVVSNPGQYTSCCSKQIPKRTMAYTWQKFVVHKRYEMCFPDWQCTFPQVMIRDPDLSILRFCHLEYTAPRWLYSSTTS